MMIIKDKKPTDQKDDRQKVARKKKTADPSQMHDVDVECRAGNGTIDMNDSPRIEDNDEDRR